MTDRFDDMSKHVARKYSRRGMFRLLGAGVLGAAAASVLPGVASADPFRRGSRLRNTTGPQWYTVDNGQAQNVLGPIRWNATKEPTGNEP